MNSDAKLYSSRKATVSTLVYYISVNTDWGRLTHSLIRGVLIQSCSAGAKKFTNYVFCHPQFSGVIQNIEKCCAIRAKFWKFDFWLYKIEHTLGDLIWKASFWSNSPSHLSTPHPKIKSRNLIYDLSQD